MFEVHRRIEFPIISKCFKAHGGEKDSFNSWRATEVVSAANDEMMVFEEMDSGPLEIWLWGLS